MSKPALRALTSALALSFLPQCASTPERRDPMDCLPLCAAQGLEAEGYRLCVDACLEGRPFTPPAAAAPAEEVPPAYVPDPAAPPPDQGDQAASLDAPPPLDPPTPETGENTFGALQQSFRAGRKEYGELMETFDRRLARMEALADRLNASRSDEERAELRQEVLELHEAQKKALKRIIEIAREGAEILRKLKASPHVAKALRFRVSKGRGKAKLATLDQAIERLESSADDGEEALLKLEAMQW